MQRTAYLSNEGRYTILETPTLYLRIIAPKPLEKYTDIIRWKDGNLTVMAKYSVYEKPIEEYIDIQEAVQELGLKAEEYLDPIERVILREEVYPREVQSSDGLDVDFSFEKLENGLVRVVDQNHPKEVYVLSREGEIIESCMNEQRLQIAREILRREKASSEEEQIPEEI